MSDSTATHIDARFDNTRTNEMLTDKAKEANLQGVIILGWHQDGENVYVDTNINDGPLALFAIKYAEALMMKGMVDK